MAHSACSQIERAATIADFERHRQEALEIWGLPAPEQADRRPEAAAELATVPSDLWMRKLIGRNWYHWLSLAPVFSLPPLAALILALRAGAPRYPGALAGLAAAGVSATIYATNCNDDSQLVVATWYPLATAVVAGRKALAGRKWLAW